MQLTSYLELKKPATSDLIASVVNTYIPEAFDIIDSHIQQLEETAINPQNALDAEATLKSVLYTRNGTVARLTVDRFFTGSPLLGTEKIYFIMMQEQYLQFVEGTRTSTQAHYRNEDSESLYWDSSEHTYMTTEVTDYPVIGFIYDLLVKLEINFELGDSGYMEPKIILGAGAGVSGHPEYGKGYIYKGVDGLLLQYLTTTGEPVSVYLSEDGLIQSGSTGEQGLRNIAISAAQPTEAQEGDLWINPNDYSHYDVASVSEASILTVDAEEVVLASGTITLTLFTAVGNKGVIRIVKNTGSGTVTLDGNASETIDGATTKDLAAGAYCTIISDGANWQVIG